MLTGFYLEGEEEDEVKSRKGKGENDDKREPGSSAASVAGSEKDDSSVVTISAPAVPITLRPHQATLKEGLVWDPECLDAATGE